MGDGGTALMFTMFVAPPVDRLATWMLVVAAMTAKLSVEFISVKLLMGVEGVPAVPVSVNVALVIFRLPVPPPLTMFLAASVAPLMLIVPAVPAVSVPVVAASVSVLLTRKAPFVLRTELV